MDAKGDNGMVRRRIIKILSLLFFAVGPLAHASTLAQKFIDTDKKMQKLDLGSEKVMGELYKIDYTMNRTSKMRDRFSRELASVQNQAAGLALSIVRLERRIKKQKHQLSIRLRAMYMISNEGVVRAIFSSTSALELDQDLKYLKLISEHDLKLIANFHRNMAELSRKRVQLDNLAAHLLRVRHRLKIEVNQLAQSQNEKSSILKKLSRAEASALKKFAELRARAGNPQLANLINLNFFEHKGELPWPVNAPVSEGYGYIKPRHYNFVLEHKGYDFYLKSPTKVRSIFSGRVAFLGRLPGYERVVILNHGDHFYSVYAKLNKTMVKAGQKVTKGQVLALADHDLYFEIRHFSDAINPKPWLNKRTMRGQL